MYRPLICLIVATVLTLSACGGSPASRPPATSSPATGDTASSVGFGPVQWRSDRLVLDKPGSDTNQINDVAVNDSLVATIGFRSFKGDDDDVLEAFNRSDGRRRWQVRESSLLAAKSHRGIVDDGVWVGDTTKAAVVAELSSTTNPTQLLGGFDARSGKLSWIWTPPDLGVPRPRIASVTGGDGNVLVATVTDLKTESDRGACQRGTGTFLTAAIDMTTGKTLWQQRGLCAGQVTGPYLLDGSEVIDARSGKVVWHAHEFGEVLGISGNVILWAVGADVDTNHDAPVLVDITDPDAKLPRFPAGRFERIRGQHALLRAVYDDPATGASTTYSYVDGDSKVISSGTGRDIDAALPTAPGVLLSSTGGRLEARAPDGRLLATWQGPASGVGVEGAGNDFVLLKSAGRFALLHVSR